MTKQRFGGQEPCTTHSTAWDGRMRVAVFLVLVWLPTSSRTWSQESSSTVETYAAQSIDELSTSERSKLESYISKLIEQLGVESFAQRQRAESELRRIGMLAFDQLLAATIHPDPQIASTSHYLLESTHQVWSLKSDPFEVGEILENYGNESQEERISRIDRLADLPWNISLAALCRLARYETNHRLSKHAAIVILQSSEKWEREKKWMDASIIRQVIGKNHREACRWLLQLADELETQRFDSQWWTEVAKEQKEIATKRDSPIRVSDAMDLHQWICSRKMKFMDRDGAVATAISMIDLVPATTERLLDACHWSLQIQLPEFVEHLNQRFERKFHDSALLCYALAESFSKQNKLPAAQSKALETLHRSAPTPSMAERENIAGKLLERAHYEWAEAELREALKAADTIHRDSWLAADSLSNLLKDGEQYDRAAEVWLPFVERLKAEPAYRTQIDDTFKDGVSQSRTTIAQYHYLRALEAEKRKDTPAMYRELVSALESNDEDIDVAIGLYRIRDYEDSDAKFRLSKSKLEKSLRKSIMESAGELNSGRNNLTATMRFSLATSLNNLAWLLSNTDGDYKEALAMVERACTILPDTAIYVDTHARCHFANGNLEEAVKLQTMAVQREPYTRSMQRQLREFEEALAKKKTSVQSP